MDRGFDDLADRRLPNWGRFCWRELMAYAPGSFCITGIYDMGPRGEDDGYGQIDGNTVLAPQPEPARAELPEIDDADAESLDFTIAQLAKPHRIILNRVYVLRGRRGPPSAWEAAVRAILAAGDENARVHARMGGLQRG